MVLCLNATIAIAGVTGKIAGVVQDEQTGEPLAGVNVFIESLSIGAATGADGHYVILNVPAGHYAVRASIIGYTSMIVEDVAASIDRTTTINIYLTTEVLEAGSTVTVTADRPLLRKDEFASRHLVTAEDIDIQPIDSFMDLARNQAGVVGSHFRGGRSGEVLVLIDGIAIRDNAGEYSGDVGGFTALIPEYGIQEMEVSLGGFGAEYGNVQSGILNLAMKEGGNHYTGMVRYTSTNFGESLNNTSMGRRGEWYDTYNQHVLENTLQFNIAGPEPITSYFLPIVGVELPRPMKVSFTAEINNKPQGYFINQQSEDVSLQGKLSYKVTPKINLALGGLYSSQDWDQFHFAASKYGPGPDYPVDQYAEVRSGTKFQYNYVDDHLSQPQGVITYDSGVYNNEQYDSVATYYIAGMQEYLWNYHKNSRIMYSIFTHSLSPTTYYEIRLNSFTTNYHYATQDVDDRDSDGDTKEDLEWDINIEGAPNPIYREREANYWWVRGDDPGYRDQSSWNGTVKADLVSQVNQNHMFKGGIEFINSRTKVENISWTLNLGAVRKDIWDRESYDLGIYLQDKIEYEEIIALVGLRYDLFDPTGLGGEDVLYPADYNFPYSEVDENNIPVLTNPDKAVKRSQISPRIGISHPITDRTVIHFTYGHYFQRPDAYYLYRNLSFQSLTKVGNYIGNPSLKPEKTVGFEVGAEHLLADDIKVSVTGYNKDITDLMNWRKYVGRSIQNIELNVFTNADYGNIRGFELNIEKVLGRWWGGMLNYSFAVAKGRSSSPFGGSSSFTSARRLNILDFDQTHTVNTTLTFLTRDKSFFGLKIGPVQPLANWRASFLTRYGNGLPYSSYGTGLINDKRQPYTINTDLRLNKEIKIIGASCHIFVDVLNLFDRQNVDWIGSTLYYEKEDDPTIVRAENVEASEYSRNPQAYSDPRQLRMGISVKF
ncbi:MAG: TonB-dependent receptor [Candidatus Marinimicrobia bacterium]|nr:TonB-dependent receptor [Candidatus Neomarinimicrobiota bacterium]